MLEIICFDGWPTPDPKAGRSIVHGENIVGDPLNLEHFDHGFTDSLRLLALERLNQLKAKGDGGT